MPALRKWLMLLGGLLLGACGGCRERSLESPESDGGRAAQTSHAASSGFAKREDGGVYPPEERLTIQRGKYRLAGRIDLTNRYPSIVSVETQEPTRAGVKGHCSGVLIGPRLVLTAGHCVCLKRGDVRAARQGKSIIDGTSCATAPTTRAYAYEPPLGNDTNKAPGFQGWDYEALEVRPHPELELLIDEQGRVESGRADLAVIVLSEPVEDVFPAVPLADKEARTGELIAMVSYTFDELLGGGAGERRIQHYKILGAPSPGGRGLFEQPERHLFKGDSGGPCLRAESGGPAIVGISSRGLGDEPSFTSTFPYRDWLRAEIQRAAEIDLAMHRK